MILRARYVAPVDGPVIEDGFVAAEGGRIVEVGPWKKPRTTTGETLDYGDAVITPGFVNAHTHLDLSDLGGKVPPSADLIDWLSRLMKLRSAMTVDETTVAESVRLGVEQSLASGVTTVGDVTSSPDWTRPMLARSYLRSVSYGEVIAIGQRRGLLERRLAAALSRDWAAPRVRVGVSPHSPYTVEPAAMKRCGEEAEKHLASVCVHLLESPHEEEFARTASGSLREYLVGLKVWDERVTAADCDPVELLRRSGLVNSRLLLAHVNYVSDTQISLLAECGVSVAFCPRTHAAFGHPPHRCADMLARGINVCIGTDSLASNPSLSVLDELRQVRRSHPQISPETLLRMGTIHGAKALGFGEEVGTLSPRRWADMTVIPLEQKSAKDSLAAILSGKLPPLASYVAGKRVHPVEPGDAR